MGRATKRVAEKLEAKQPGFNASELRLLDHEVERILLASGLPLGTVSNFGTLPARCKVHSDIVQLDLRLPHGSSLQVLHCGCDHLVFPNEPPPEGPKAMAQDLAEEIIWYWGKEEEALAVVASVREALQREIDRNRSLRIDCGLGEVWLGKFETYWGRAHWVHAEFDLTGNNLQAVRDRSSFRAPAEVTRYFRSDRPYQKDLAARRDELAKLGARGAIDVVAVNALRQAGKDPLKAVAYLAEIPEGIRIEHGGAVLRLRWRMGTIEGHFDLAPGIHWSFGEVRFSKDSAPTTDKSEIDKPIKSFASSPLLPDDLLVYSAREHLDGRRTFIVKPPLKLFDVVGGKGVWVEAAV